MRVLGAHGAAVWHRSAQLDCIVGAWFLGRILTARRVGRAVLHRWCLLFAAGYFLLLVCFVLEPRAYYLLHFSCWCCCLLLSTCCPLTISCLCLLLAAFCTCRDCAATCRPFTVSF